MNNQLAKTGLSAILAMLIAITPLVQTKLILDTTLLPRQFLLLGFTSILCLILAVNKKSIAQNISIELLTPLLGLAFVYFLSNYFALNLPEAQYSSSKMILLVATIILLIWTIESAHINTNLLFFGIVVSSFIGLFLLGLEMNKLTKTGIQLWSQKNLYELKSAFGHKNLYASYQLLCLPFILLLFLKSKTWQKVVLGVLVLGILLSLILVQTKAVLLALAFSICSLLIIGLILGAIGSNQKKVWLISSISIVLVFGYSILTFFPEKLSLLRSNDTIIERYLLWKNSWQMLKEFPVLGVGAGNWQIYFPKYGLGDFMQTNYLISDGFTTFQRPHNDFLWVACETGILGISLYVFIFGYALRQCWVSIKNKVAEGWIIGGGLLAYIFVAAVDFPLERNEHQLLAGFLLALACKKETVSQKHVPTWLLLIVTAGLSYSLWVGLNRFEAEKICKKMAESYSTGNYSNMLLNAQNIDQNHLSIDNYSIPIDWYKGLALYAMDRKDLALLANQKAYAVNPYQIHVINNLAGLYHENDSLQHALILYNEVLQISPTQPDALLNKCAVLYNLGQTKMAFETLYLFKYDAQNQQFMQSLLSVGYAFFKESTGIEFNEIQLKQWFLKSKEKEYTFEQSILHQP